jgi:hypothetical protein
VSAFPRSESGALNPYGRGIIRDGRPIEERSSVIETKVQCLVGNSLVCIQGSVSSNQASASVPLIKQ